MEAIYTQPAGQSIISPFALLPHPASHRPTDLMNKVLLLILLIVLPWQTIAAAERTLTHMMSGQASNGFGQIGKHLADHDAHVLHHHEDRGDGQPHVDQSEKSLQHLNDFEHGCSAAVLLPAALQLSSIALPCLPPIPWPESFSDRTTLPPLPPPRSRA